VASQGFGVRGARRSRRRRREHQGAKGAEWGGVCGGVSAPQPTRGLGSVTRPPSHFLHFRPQNASGSKTKTVAALCVKLQYCETCNCLKNCKFHFEKVAVTVTTTVKSGGDKSPSSHTKLRLWPRRGDRRRCRQPPRLSTSFVDSTIDLPWRNFRSPEIGTTSQMEVLLVSDISEYPSNSLQCRIDGRKRVRAKTQLDPFSRFDTLRVHAQKLSVSLPYAVE